MAFLRLTDPERPKLSVRTTSAFLGVISIFHPNTGNCGDTFVAKALFATGNCGNGVLVANPSVIFVMILISAIKFRSK